MNLQYDWTVSFKLTEASLTTWLRYLCYLNKQHDTIEAVQDSQTDAYTCNLTEPFLWIQQQQLFAIRLRYLSYFTTSIRYSCSGYFNTSLHVAMLQLLTIILNSLNKLKLVGKQKSMIIEAQNAVMKKLTENAPTDAKVNSQRLFAVVYCLLIWYPLYCCGSFIYIGLHQCMLLQ